MSGNSGGNGAGLHGSITISNSTLTANSSSASGGALYVDSGGTLTAINVTVSGNSAHTGGGLGTTGTGSLKISNSIISGNTATISGADCTSGVADQGYNLEYGNTSCAFSNHAFNGNPNLGSLADNGGPTMTMALGTSSAAVGYGSVGICNTAPISDLDQRGNRRLTVFRKTCDIGAYDTGFGSGPSLTQTFGYRCPSWTVNCPQGFSLEPVNMATGDYVSSVTDLRLPGPGIPFVFSRTYNSLDPTVGPLGVGWTHSYNAHLNFNTDGTIGLVSEGGAFIPFVPVGAGNFSAANGAKGSLTTITGGYQATTRDQMRYTFNSTGALTSEIDPNGNTLGFAYSSGRLTTITDTAGRTISLTYDGSGRLAQLTDPIGRTVHYGYDGSGRLSSVTDVAGGITAYGYDGSNRLTTITDQMGRLLVTNVYGTDGRVSSQTDSHGNLTTYSFNPATGASTVTDPASGTLTEVYDHNKLMSSTDQLSHTTSYTYDADFNVLTVTDPLGRITTMTYDANGRLLTSTAPSPLSYVQAFTYDSAGRLLTATDGLGHTTTMVYDSTGNLTSVTDATGATRTFTYNSKGLPLTSTDPLTHTTTMAYDSAGNLTSVTSPLSELTTMTYDGAGRLLTAVDPRGHASGANPADYTSSFAYDPADHVISFTDQLGHVSSVAYDAAGNRVSAADANGHTTSYVYDAGRNLLSVTDVLGGVTAYNYDSRNNLTSRTDANGHVTSYTYDAANRLTSTTDPLSHTWSVGYDAVGNRTSAIDAKAQVITYAYDQINRLTGINYDDATPDVTYAYDAAGSRSSMTDGAGTETYAYDAANRPTGVTRGSDTFVYTYDAAGQLTSRTYPGGLATTYTYDDDGRMLTAQSGSAITSYAYDSAGELTSGATPDGLTAQYAHDAAGRLLEVANVSATDTLSRFTYGYDATGNRTGLTTATESVAFGYDNLNRLTGVCYSISGCSSDGLTAAVLPCLACIGSQITRSSASVTPDPADTFTDFTYDPVGNRLTSTDYLGTTTSAHNDADQLTSVTPPGASAVNYTFDANGNQTAAGSDTFAYDEAGHLVSATAGGLTTTYTYSGDGRRLSASVSGGGTTGFLWDENNALPELALERDGTGATLRSYLYGLGPIAMLEGGASYYYHADAMGSISDLTDATGASLAWTEYSPFGAVRSAGAISGAPFDPLGFTGQYQDPTGLYHMRARQYDLGTGRFLSADPMGQAGSGLGSLYAYASNNPLRYTDPSGRCFIVCAIGGFVAGVLGYTGSVVISNLVEGNGISLDGWSGTVALATGVTVGVAAGTFGAGLTLLAAAGESTSLFSAGSFAMASVAGPLGSGAGIIIKGLTGTPVGPSDALGILTSMVPMPDGLVPQAIETLGLDQAGRYVDDQFARSANNRTGYNAK